MSNAQNESAPAKSDASGIVEKIAGLNAMLSAIESEHAHAGGHIAELLAKVENQRSTINNQNIYIESTKLRHEQIILEITRANAEDLDNERRARVQALAELKAKYDVEAEEARVRYEQEVAKLKAELDRAHADLIAAEGLIEEVYKKTCT